MNCAVSKTLLKVFDNLYGIERVVTTFDMTIGIGYKKETQCIQKRDTKRHKYCHNFPIYIWHITNLFKKYSQIRPNKKTDRSQSEFVKIRTYNLYES